MSLPSISNCISNYVLVIAAALLMVPGVGAGAPAQQQSKGPPNALQGFSQNRGEPVHIVATRLEVRDKDKVATFSGNVHVTQGDTQMRCNRLMVFYEQQDAKPATGAALRAADPGPGGEQTIKRLEAYGSVVVTQKDQTATGKTGIYDMKTSTVTLTGGVVMTQGKNVLRGDKLVVDLNSGVSTVEADKHGSGRVEGLFQPGSQNSVLPGQTSPSAQTPR
jgi:lipopolysaccharide export system protein LptA